LAVMLAGEAQRSIDKPPYLAGAALGLSAALLFGAGVPFAKLLLEHTQPLMLAALLYLGAGLALAVVRPLVETAHLAPQEAPLRRSDVGLLAASAAFGGVVGPLLMLTGLERVSGIVGSLLLNLEAPLTILIAVLLLREHLGLRESGAALLVISGAAMLGYQPGELRADLAGIAALAGACLSWGIDNNLSKLLSVRDPAAAVQVKTLAAGACTLMIALWIGYRLPALSVLAAALVLGSISYGLSLIFHMRALRRVGAARQAAYFATGPFVGAILSVPILGEASQLTDLLAGGLMASGVILLVRERHGHAHTHEAIEHDHIHLHDEHHRGHHTGQVTGAHSHTHRHEPLTHDHPHVSDLHHRHRHT